MRSDGLNRGLWEVPYMWLYIRSVSAVICFASIFLAGSHSSAAAVELAGTLPGAQSWPD